MECPKCTSLMEDIEIEGIIIKRCTYCKGLWFNSAEHEYLKSREGGEKIDSGDPDTGKDFNKIEDIFCPACSASMIKMVDARQPHIWYESCSNCFSVFFDAGEFSDFVEENITDFFKDLFTPERK